LARFRATRSLLDLTRLKAEGRPLLTVLPFLALLLGWASYRMEFLPARPGDPITLKVFTPPTEEGRLAWIVPLHGLSPKDGWVRALAVEKDQDQTYGTASWTFTPTESPSPFPVTIRLGQGSYVHPLLVGGKVYGEAIHDHGSEIVTQWELAPARWLGFLPALHGVYCPAWMTAYILLAILFFLFFKRVLKIY
jgi:hypothetical protein